MLAPVLALAFAAAVESAPGPAPATAPEPPPAPPVQAAPAPQRSHVVIERRFGRVHARRGPDGSLVVTPGPAFVFTPGADEAGEWPRWIELAWPAGARREFTASTETLITVPKGVALQVANLVGDIRVEGWERDAVRIVARHGRRDRLEARLVGARPAAQPAPGMRRSARPAAPHARGTLQVETLTRLGIPAVVDYTITVPQWMALRLSGMESDITVEGVRAAIEAESIRGDVVVRRGRGPLQISSVEGDVRAFDWDGPLRASSINRGVELDEVSGVLVVESVNGDIRMGRVRSGDVEASSVNGTVVFRGPFEPRGRYRLASHAGNLVVGVPVGAGIDVSVSAFEGGFRSGFPLELGERRRGEKFNFVLGAGGSSLELESFQGLIELLRPAEVPAFAPAPKAPRSPRAPRAPRAPKAPRAPGHEDHREPEEDR